MTPLAREVRRARIATRRLQEKRNAAAIKEEQKRQDALRSTPKMERIAARENKMVAAPSEGNKLEEGGGDVLAGVPFGSDRARELADEFGLHAAAFRGKAHTGAKGFTAGDVRAINASLEEGPE